MNPQNKIQLRIVDPSVIDDYEPGMMWRDESGDEDDRECWIVVLPNDKPQAPGYASEIWWHTTQRASKAPHAMWEVTGSPPHITVKPSLDVECWVTKDGKLVREGSYWHGWITDGFLVWC